MSPAWVYLTLANCLFFIGTLRLIYGVYKDRSSLRGYDPMGSFLTTVASFLVLLYLYEETLWWSFWLSISTFIYWLYVSVILVTYEMEKEIVNSIGSPL